VVAVDWLPPPSAPQDLLVEAVDALAGQSPTELAGAVALDRTRVLLAQTERLSALALQALSDVERRELYLLDGATCAGSWVHGLQLPGVDRTALALARRLHTVPAVAAALRAGQLSTRAAAAVTVAAGRARPFLDRPDNHIDGQPAGPVLRAVLVDGISMLLAEQTGGAPDSDPEQAQLRAELHGVLDSAGSQQDRLERGLLRYAQRSNPTQLSSGLALLLDALLPAQHDARARRAHDQAGLDLHRKHSGSGWTLRGELDEETGELLFTLLGAEHAVDPDNPTDTNAWRTATSNHSNQGDTPDASSSTQAASTAGNDGGPDLTGLDPQYWPDSTPGPAAAAPNATTRSAKPCAGCSAAARSAPATKSTRTWPSPSPSTRSTAGPARCPPAPPAAPRWPAPSSVRCCAPAPSPDSSWTPTARSCRSATPNAPRPPPNGSS